MHPTKVAPIAREVTRVRAVNTLWMFAEIEATSLCCAVYLVPGRQHIMQNTSRSTSVSLITGPGTSTVDDNDLIDVTDPVRAIAKQALADLCRKENQKGNIPEGKKIIETAVDVLKGLPKEHMQLTKSELQTTAANTGNL